MTNWGELEVLLPQRPPAVPQVHPISMTSDCLIRAAQQQHVVHRPHVRHGLEARHKVRLPIRVYPDPRAQVGLARRQLRPHVRHDHREGPVVFTKHKTSEKQKRCRKTPHFLCQLLFCRDPLQLSHFLTFFFKKSVYGHTQTSSKEKRDQTLAPLFCCFKNDNRP